MITSIINYHGKIYTGDDEGNVTPGVETPETSESEESSGEEEVAEPEKVE